MLDALFVIFGASLWATDTIFRHPLVGQLSPTTIVLCEHLVACAVALVVALVGLYFASAKSAKRNLTHFPWKKLFPPLPLLLGISIIGFLGSAIATLLFTYSFGFVNPTVSILLQKTQPIIVILFSAVFLNERLPKYFGLFALAAFISAFFLSFPHGLHPEKIVEELKDADSKGVFLALSAAFFWAISTVVGKSILNGGQAKKHSFKMSSSILSFWRFFFGLVVMAFICSVTPQAKIDLAFVSLDSNVIKSLIFMAIVPGLIGVSLYYKGLSKVPASVATILELSFPLCALVINSFVLKLPLKTEQIIAAIGLLAAMVALSASQRAPLSTKKGTS